MHRVLSTLVLLFAAASASVPAAPEIRLVDRETVVLRVRPMTASVVDDEPAVREIRLADDGTGEATLRVRWPAPSASTEIRLSGVARPEGAGAGHRVRLDAAVSGPAGKATASREIAFDGSTTALFEVARDRGRPLTLVVETEVVRERTVAARPTLGPPVQFLLEVHWVEGAHDVALESNVLNTFVGEPVAYSFRLGKVGEAESLRVRLTPRRLYGDLIRVEVEVAGTLPAANEVRVVSRREEWVASRDSLNTIDVLEGEPPRGYRFVITARF